MLDDDEIALEMSRMLREAEAEVCKRIASRQLGEAFKDLPIIDDAPNMKDAHHEA